MRRFWTGVTAIAFTMLFMASSVEASPIWCEDDPIFFIDGQMVRVVTTFPRSELRADTVVRYTLTVDEDAHVRVVEPPSEVKATITIVRRDGDEQGAGDGQRPGGEHHATIHVTVNGAGSFPINVSVSGSGVRHPVSVTGTNAGVTVSVKLGR